MADIIKFIFSFFTIWSLTLYILYLFTINNTNYIPSLWITNFIISLIITIGIYGTIIIHYNKQKIIKKYKVSAIEVILVDLLIHIIPLIHVLYNKNKYISMSNISDNSFIKSITLLYTMILIYVSKFNISKIYFDMNKYLLIIPSIIIYWISLFNLTN